MKTNFRAKLDEAVDSYRKARASKKAEAEALRLLEEERRSALRAGKITPIALAVSLDQGEVAYLELQAHRMATIERIEEHTTGKSKKSGVAGRAIVGGVLLGPLGALGGAATAGSKSKSVTTQKSIYSTETVDSGKLILTSRRFLFIGNNVVSIPYHSLLAIAFDPHLAGKSQFISLKYEGMLDGERFFVSGSQVDDTALYYTGITQPNVEEEPVARRPQAKRKQLG